MVASHEKRYTPVAAGVPEMTPVDALRDKPGGRLR
jgi:hypothetical protein